MPTLSVGRTSRAESGVTLIEMMAVVVIVALMAAISVPAVTSGIDTLRLNAAAQGLVAFFNTGLSRAERRQQAVEISISKAENTLSMRTTDASFLRQLVLPEGVTIERILPEFPQASSGARSFLLYPGGVVPPFGVVLRNRRNVIRMVRVDPMTGVPLVTEPNS